MPLGSTTLSESCTSEFALLALRWRIRRFLRETIGLEASYVAQGGWECRSQDTLGGGAMRNKLPEATVGCVEGLFEARGHLLPMCLVEGGVIANRRKEVGHGGPGGSVHVGKYGPLVTS